MPMSWHLEKYEQYVNHLQTIVIGSGDKFTGVNYIFDNQCITIRVLMVEGSLDYVSTKPEDNVSTFKKAIAGATKASEKPTSE